MVEEILGEVEARGDAAVRDLSARLDKVTSLLAIPAAIETILASLPAQTIDDIKFAQAQVRTFAQTQRAVSPGCGSRNLARCDLGSQTFPSTVWVVMYLAGATRWWPRRI